MRRFEIEALESRFLMSSVRFAVIGDFGKAGANELSVANRVKSWNPDLILTVGDNNYESGSASTIEANVGQYYHEYIYGYTGPNGAGSPTQRFLPTLGNHDWGNVASGGNANGYLNYFNLPGNERYYEYVQGPVHFFMIDSDTNEPDGVSAGSVQGQWLQSRLAAATEPHKVVVFHHAPYSSGSHGSETRMRWPFAKWGATAVFTGHEHIYERLNEEGIPYFINGLGGASITSVGTAIAGSQFRYNGDYGAMLVDANDTTMQFQFITDNGVLIDSYTIDLANTNKLIRAGGEWKYLDTGSAPATAWKGGSAFNDSTWLTGSGQFGYGEGDESTTVSYGSSASNKRITTYFRNSFNIANPAAITALNLSMLRDDGAVVYLNGTEVFRTNMPTGTISSTTLASSDITGQNEGNYFSPSVPVSPSLLLAGNNVLAVELHQRAANSDDTSFDLALTATGDFTAPLVSAVDYDFDARPMSLRVTFNENVGASLDDGDLRLVNHTTNQTYSGSSWIDFTGYAGNVATFTFSSWPNGILPNGNWTATVLGATITDAAQNHLSDRDADFYVLGADATRDRKVDINDMVILLRNWMLPLGKFTQGDFNYDGTIDRADLSILARNWNTTLEPPLPRAPVPASGLPRRPPVRTSIL